LTLSAIRKTSQTTSPPTPISPPRTRARDTYTTETTTLLSRLLLGHFELFCVDG